jgi:hypothetical protein
MKTDWYTRVVLTGILLCLLWLCVVVTPVGTPVAAQAAPAVAPQDVRIVGIKQPEMSRPVGGGPAKPAGDWDPMPTYAAPQAQPERPR